MARNGSSRPTLDETRLLAWIEDDLAAEDRLQIERALESDPAMRSTVQRLRADRLALVEMGDEPAPADLLLGVADLLEREMLVGLTDDSDLADAGASSIPVSKVRPIRTRPAWARTITASIAAVVADRTGRRLALAAGLLIAAGGLAYFVSLNINPATKGTIDPLTNPKAIARTNPDAPTPLAGALPVGDDRANPTGDDAASGPGPTRLAHNDTTAADPSAGDRISLARAVELARAGRLVIRVRTGDSDRALMLLDRAGERSTSVSVSDKLAPALASSLRTRPEATNPAATDPALPDPIVIAGSHEPAPAGLPGTDRSTSPPQPQVWRVAGLRLVEMDLTERTLASALRSIAGGGASFEAADAPMDLPAASDPARVLWWGEPTSAWVPRTVVPVVIETQR